VRVPVLADDSAERLAARVLEREHPLLLASVRLLATGQVNLGDDGVELNGQRLAAPLQLASTNILA